MAGCMVRSAISAGSRQPAASVSIPSGRGGSLPSPGRDGVKAQGELLVDAAVGVDQNVAGVAVDPGHRGEFDRDPGFLGDLQDEGLPGGLADLDPASGKFPVAVVDAADQQDLPGGVADRGERGREQVVCVTGARILVVLVQPDHAPDLGSQARRRQVAVAG